MAGSVDKLLRTAQTQAKSGAFREAEATYRELLARFPANKRAQAGLAELAATVANAVGREPPRQLIGQLFALKRAGRDRDMVALVKKARMQFPRSLALLEIHANGLSALNDREGAAALYRELTKLNPLNPDYFGNLGNELMLLGKYDEAEDAYERILELQPTNPVALNNLGNVKNRLEFNKEALDHYEAAVKAAPNYVEARLNLAETLLSYGDVAKAGQQVEEVLKIDPGNLYARTKGAIVTARMGDKEAAREQIEAVLAIEPHFGPALKVKAGNHTFVKDDPFFGVMDVALQDPTIVGKDRANLEFTLGRARNDLDEPEAAFAHFARGNAIRKELVGYHISKDEKLFAEIKAGFAEPRPALPAETGQGPDPIFILGMPRSGTTLVEQIVTAHPMVAPGGELTDLGTGLRRFDWADPNGLQEIGPELRASYRETLKSLAGDKPYVTDKMPLNFRFIGVIKVLFPDAKIINLHRDPRAVLWSIYHHNFASDGNAYAHDLDDLVDYWHLYKDMMAHWNALYPGQIFDLKYEALTEDPDTVIRSLIDYLGLPWDEACLRPQDNKRVAKTASREQVKKPIYKGSSNAWQKYRPFVEKAFSRLDVWTDA